MKLSFVQSKLVEYFFFVIVHFFFRFSILLNLLPKIHVQLCAGVSWISLFEKSVICSGLHIFQNLWYVVGKIPFQWFNLQNLQIFNWNIVCFYILSTGDLIWRLEHTRQVLYSRAILPVIWIKFSTQWQIQKNYIICIYRWGFLM